MQGVLRGLILGIIPLFFGGCYAGTAGLVLGILALSEDGGSKGGPHAASLKIHESPEGAGLGRAADLASVGISFDLIGVRLEDAADFTLEFERSGEQSPFIDTGHVPALAGHRDASRRLGEHKLHGLGRGESPGESDRPRAGSEGYPK